MAKGPYGYADTKAERGIGSQVRSLLELEPIALHRQILAWPDDGRVFADVPSVRWRTWPRPLVTRTQPASGVCGRWGTRSASAHALPGEGCRAGRTDRQNGSQSGEEGCAS